MRTGEVEGAPTSVSGPECCMCGDHGLSSELFKCNCCGFRSQHKYCSNMYPGAESYHICNWCLSQQDEENGEDITKSSQNSSHKTTMDHHNMKIKKRKIDVNDEERRTIDNGIKKPSKFTAAVDRAAPLPAAGRKRVTRERGGRIINRNRSEEVSKGGNGIIIKPLFRNKVRRYKLLDEVSS